jgi:mannosyltransferase OCH1-like enzyme
MASIAMLWFHNPLTAIQRLSMRSFQHHGHSVTLYTYGDFKAVDGVILADANEFIKEEEIFTAYDSYAAFADIFRYRMLAGTEHIWADADTVCLRPDWNFGEYVLSYQEPNKVSNNVIGYPQDCPLADKLIQEAVFQENKIYDHLGPILVTRLVKELGLKDKVLPEYVFNPIYWRDFRDTYDPSKLDQVLAKCQGSHAVSLSNYMLKYHNLDRENFPAGSAVAYWDKLFK